MTLTLPIIITGLVIAAIIVFIITRYAAAIGRFILTAGALVVALVTASALVTQGAATLKQAQATNNAVKVVKTMATTQIITVTVGACIFGSLVTFATICLIIAVALYYRQKVATDPTSGRRQIVTTPTRRSITPPHITPGHTQARPPPLTQPPTYYPPQPTVDITEVNLEDWGW